MFAQAFLAQSLDFGSEVVSTPVGDVVVKALSAQEKDAFDVAHSKAKGEHFRARLVVATAHELNGAKAFTDANIPTLSAMPIYYLEPMVDAAIRVNKISDVDAENLRKN